ncbi:NADH:flavin oxidoreductase [Desulfopila sp. IMCC35008]|uniref:NADH:flavin oxidoreductase n=1 Tax=Desulfopila sp. IMCC35008 TaxID=2653858 RepID=UPI0013D0DE51|nr:NADH:flavin oxidoreductase [Desulfopila sp. IMCC35008]
MKTLFDEIRIGSLVARNRLWRAATWLNMADDKGHLTARLEKVYLDLAKGGVGTIITGYANVLEEEQPNPRMLGIYNDSFIAEYLDFTKKIKAEGANIVMQIAYGGSFTAFQPDSREIWGPSPVPHPLTKVIPTEMSQDNINTLISAFALASARVKASGFDGVELHAAHSYLLSQFLSPYYNQRTDQYGGPIENRARIVIEVLDAVRKEVGADYPVFIKMHCTDDWADKGLTEDESLYVAQELEKRGIAAIEFSGGNLDDEEYPNMGPGRKGILKVEKQSYFAEATARIAEQLKVPVISVGGHRTPDKLEGILNSTKIECFSLSRVLHSEPDIINRWQKDKTAKPRCLSCNKCWDKNGNICILIREPIMGSHVSM